MICCIIPPMAFNPFMPSGHFYLSFWTGSFQFKGLVFRYHLFIEIREINSNRVDPSAALF